MGEHRRARLVRLRMQAALNRWDGRPEQAIADLEEALLIAEALDLPGEAWQIAAALADANAAAGRGHRVGEARQRALDTIHRLAAGIHDSTVRETFVDGAIRVANASAGRRVEIQASSEVSRTRARGELVSAR
jgi:hypothetical protein